jgi:hypothetical protein
MKLLTALCLCALLAGCKPLYRVEPFPSETDTDEWRTMGVYRLPRTDLRVDAEVAIRAYSYGQHYCFGKALGIDEGRVGSDPCEAACLPPLVMEPLIRKFEITPVTVPDASTAYAFQIRNNRRASKRAAELTMTKRALISGGEREEQAEQTRIAFGAFTGGERLLPRAFVPFGTPPQVTASTAQRTTPTCADVELSATRAADELRVKKECFAVLSAMRDGMALSWPQWSRVRQCSRLVKAFGPEFEGLSGGEAVDELGPQVEKIQASFARTVTSATYSFQKWIRVDQDQGNDPDNPNLAVGHPVGLCRGEGTTVRVCTAEGNSPFVYISLTQPAIDALEVAPETPPHGKGLVYRLPQTLLLHGELRPAKTFESADGVDDASAFRSHQVGPVTFAQLGPLLRAPDKVKGGFTTVRTSVSEETGMLTKIDISLQPLKKSKSGGGTLKTVQTLNYQPLSEESTGAAASKLEQDNRLLKAQQENNRLRALSKDLGDAGEKK